MFLRNYWEYKRFQCTYDFYINGNQPYAYPCVMKAIDGSYTKNMPCGNWSNYSYSTAYTKGISSCTNPYYYWAMVVGTGTTPADNDDYCLESDITSTLSNASNTKNFGVSDSGEYVARFNCSFTNNTNSDITISEVGIKATFCNLNDATQTPTTSGNMSQKQVLLIRKVLDTPVTIGVGATEIITLEVKMS